MRRRSATVAGVAALMLTLGLTACFEIPAAPKADPVPLPPELCNQAREGLEKLIEAGTLQRTKPGEAAMAEQDWIQLPQSNKDQMAQLLGYDAACSASAPSLEQTIVVRSEYGRVMTRQIVPTSPDMSELLGN